MEVQGGKEKRPTKAPFSLKGTSCSRSRLASGRDSHRGRSRTFEILTHTASCV